MTKTSKPAEKTFTGIIGGAMSVESPALRRIRERRQREAAEEREGKGRD